MCYIFDMEVFPRAQYISASGTLVEAIDILRLCTVS